MTGFRTFKNLFDIILGLQMVRLKALKKFASRAKNKVVKVCLCLKITGGWVPFKIKKIALS